ncbi:MAG: ammonia channel protein, partial [Alphaproteobacteria bacterium]
MKERPPEPRFGRRAAKCTATVFAASTLLSLASAAGAAEEAAKIDTGDTAWMLVSAALVLMMTAPGLALFYGGLVRSQN